MVSSIQQRWNLAYGMFTTVDQWLNTWNRREHNSKLWYLKLWFLLWSNPKSCSRTSFIDLINLSHVCITLIIMRLHIKESPLSIRGYIKYVCQKHWKFIFLLNNTIHKSWHSITTRSPQIDSARGDVCHVCYHWSTVVNNPWAKVHFCWIEETVIQNCGLTNIGFYYDPITKVAAELHSLIWSL